MERDRSREYATVTPPSLSWEERTVRAAGERRKNVKPNPVQLMEPGAHGLLGQSALLPVGEEQGHEHTCVTALIHSMAARNAQESPRTLIPATNRTALLMVAYLTRASGVLTAPVPLMARGSAGPALSVSVAMEHSVRM